MDYINISDALYQQADSFHFGDWFILEGYMGLGVRAEDRMGSIREVRGD